MPKRVPIRAARDLARQYGLSHVIILAHDGEQDHVVTYGHSLKACSQAAEFGNKLKAAMGWPESLQAQPSRVRKLQSRIKELEEKLGEGRDDHSDLLAAENCSAGSSVAEQI